MADFKMNYNYTEEEASIKSNSSFSISYISSYNSKRMCFFCFNDISISTAINSDIRLFPLRNFARILKFNGIERSLSEKGRVEVCHKCSQLTEEFTELNKLLEEMQLRVNWCVRKIYEVMRRSNSEQNALRKDDESAKGNIFARLRRCAILGGRKRMQEMLSPVVVLKKMRLSRSEQELRKYGHGHDDAIAEVATNDDDGVDGADNPLPQSFNLEEESITKSELDHDPLETKSTKEQEIARFESIYDDLSSQDPLTAQASLSPLTPYTKETVSSENKEHLSCPYCRAIFVFSEKTLTNQQGNFALHLVQYHCEHFFPTQRLDLISPQQYKRILVDLLFRDFCNEEMNNFLCPICQKPCKSNVNRFKLHLIKEHWKELETKLISIQQTPQLFEKLTTTNPNGIYCKCGAYLVNLMSQSQHLLHHCKLTTPNSKRIDLPCNVHVESNVCPYCKVEIRGSSCKTKLRQHMITFHMEHFFPNARNEAVVTEAQFKRILADMLFMNLIERHDSECRICGKKFVDHNSSRRVTRAKDHFIEEHYEILMGKLHSIQEDPTLGERLKCIPAGVMCSCGMYLKNQRSRALHEKFFKCLSHSPGETIMGADYVDYDAEGPIHRKDHCPERQHLNDLHPPQTATITDNLQSGFRNPNTVRSPHYQDESPPFYYHQMNASLHLSVNFQRNWTFEPEPQQQKWNCDMCGYLFFFKEMLENHQRNDCIYSTTTTANVVDYPAQGQLSTFRNEDVSVRMMNGGTTWEVGNDRCIK